MARPNPGSFELLQREIQETFLTHLVFDGGKVDVGKPLNNEFQAIHRFRLGSQSAPSSYQFGAILVTGNTLLMGDMDTTGAFNARANFGLTPSLMFKNIVQVQPNVGSAYVHELDYTGSDYTASIKVYNPNLLRRIGTITASYLQSVTPKLAVGVEGTAQFERSGRIGSQINVAARYNGPNYVAVATANQAGELSASYFHQVNETVNVGTETQVKLGSREAVTTLGVKFDFRSATMRAQADTHGRVCLFLEERIGPGFSFLISGELDHYNSESKFGVGVQIGQ